jgi:acetoin utilization protein AcuB
MTRSSPTVSAAMTTAPYSIGPDETLAVAHALMRHHALRHLPVIEKGKLIGVVSLRDLHRIESVRRLPPVALEVRDAMTTDVYAVPSGTPLAEVALEMAHHRYGCTIVVDDGCVIGVFTVVDACRAVHDLLVARRAS